MSHPSIIVRILLLIAAGCAPAAQAAGQPIEVHASGLSSEACATCHLCDRPTAQDPCLQPCLRTSPTPTRPSFEPPHAPGRVLLGELEHLYEPVPFDHAIHAEMAALTTGCAACHHRTPEGTPHPACRTCHEPSRAGGDSRMPGLRGAYHRQCLSCHRAWRHDTACESCHRPKSAPGRGVVLAAARDPHETFAGARAPVSVRSAFVYRTSHEPVPVVTFHHRDHAEVFGLTCLDCHQGESCERCHDTVTERPVFDRRSRCASCHGQDDCRFCHDAVQRPSFDHAASTGWSLRPYHAQVRCVQCHGSDRDHASPSPVCHSCHTRLAVPARIDTAGGPSLEQCSREIECLACHRELSERLDRSTVVHGATKGPNGCTSCHGGLLATAPRPPAEQQKTLCLSCHDRRIDSTQGRPLTNIAALLTEAPNHHGPIRDGRCCDCHQPHASEHGRLLVAAYPSEFYAAFEVDTYALCFDCHEKDRVLDRSGTRLTDFRNGDRNLHWVHVNQRKGRTCRACHDVHASSRPFHIRDAVPFGQSEWMMPIDYRQTRDGGTCAPACHAPQTYRRGPGQGTIVARLSAPGNEP